jgi:hypothetical protein
MKGKTAVIGFFRQASINEQNRSRRAIDFSGSEKSHFYLPRSGAIRDGFIPRIHKNTFASLTYHTPPLQYGTLFQ